MLGHSICHKIPPFYSLLHNFMAQKETTHQVHTAQRKISEVYLKVVGHLIGPLEVTGLELCQVYNSGMLLRLFQPNI